MENSGKESTPADFYGKNAYSFVLQNENGQLYTLTNMNDVRIVASDGKIECDAIASKQDGDDQSKTQQPNLPHVSATTPFVNKQRRQRTIYTVEQVAILEHWFTITRYPDVCMRDKLACEIDLHQSRIQVWFKNRRAKAKKLEKHQMPVTPETQTQTQTDPSVHRATQTTQTTQHTQTANVFYPHVTTELQSPALWTPASIYNQQINYYPLNFPYLGHNVEYHHQPQLMTQFGGNPYMISSWQPFNFNPPNSEQEQCINLSAKLGQK